MNSKYDQKWKISSNYNYQTNIITNSNCSVVNIKFLNKIKCSVTMLISTTIKRQTKHNVIDRHGFSQVG